MQSKAADVTTYLGQVLETRRDPHATAGVVLPSLRSSTSRSPEKLLIAAQRESGP